MINVCVNPIIIILQLPLWSFQLRQVEYTMLNSSSQYFKVKFRIFVEKKIEKKKKYLTNITIHNYNYIYMSIVIYT